MRNIIEDTNAFKSMAPFKQSIYRSSKNMKRLCEQLVIAKNIGYEKWKESKPSDTEDKIIKELINL